ncbi:glycoside hydrolase family 117 protein [Bacteroidota bacterium]
MSRSFKNHFVQIGVIAMFTALSIQCTQNEIKESAAMRRYRVDHGNLQETKSEFYTKFLYSDAKGLGEEVGISRRDPTTILKIDDTYYIWYTRSEGDRPPVGPRGGASTECWEKANPRIRTWCWDYASIWYATSKDGFNWEEQGVAVTPGPPGNFDCRSVFTPDIMFVNDRYYLYYQADSNIRENPTLIGMSWADSPTGPWHRHDKPVLLPAEGTRVCHDPNLIVRDGKYWLYYKGGVASGENLPSPAWGVAIADKPEGPFIPSEWNPVTNSGHEVFVWPYKEGVAALLCRNGYEKNSIQYAKDGVNFEVMATVRTPPIAPGGYIPDKYTNTKNGEGLTWGLCHVRQAVHPESYKEHLESYLIRFDCDLSRVEEKPRFKLWWVDDPGCTYKAPGNRLNYPEE